MWPASHMIQRDASPKLNLKKKVSKQRCHTFKKSLILLSWNSSSFLNTKASFCRQMNMHQRRLDTHSDTHNLYNIYILSSRPESLTTQLAWRPQSSGFTTSGNSKMSMGTFAFPLLVCRPNYKGTFGIWKNKPLCIKVWVLFFILCNSLRSYQTGWKTNL